MARESTRFGTGPLGRSEKNDYFVLNTTCFTTALHFKIIETINLLEIESYERRTVMILLMKIAKTATASLLNLRHADVCVEDVSGVFIGKGGIATDLPRSSTLPTGTPSLVTAPVK